MERIDGETIKLALLAFAGYVVYKNFLPQLQQAQQAASDAAIAFYNATHTDNPAQNSSLVSAYSEPDGSIKQTFSDGTVLTITPDIVKAQKFTAPPDPATVTTGALYDALGNYLGG